MKYYRVQVDSTLSRTFIATYNNHNIDDRHVAHYAVYLRYSRTAT